MTSLSDHIRRNARIMIVGWAIGQVLQTLRAPIFIYFLGLAGFGLWQIAFLVMGYISIYNVGFDNAYLKFAGEYNAKKEYKELSHLLSTGIALAWIMGAAMFLAVYIFAEDIVTLMMNRQDITPDAAGEHRAKQAWFLIVVIAGCNWYKMVMGVHQAVLTGIQRLDLVQWVFLILGPIEFCVMISVLYAGYGVRALVLVYACFMVLGLLCMGLINRRLVPELRIRPWLARKRHVAPLFSLGGRMQILGLFAILANTVDTFAINKAQGLELVGAYGTAQRLSLRVRGLAQQGFGILTPASADLHGREDYTRLTELYTSSMRICFLVTIYIYAFLGVNADLTMMVFLGEENMAMMDVAVLTLLAFCVGRVFHTLTGPASSMLRGGGKPGLETLYQIVTILLFAGFFMYALQSEATTQQILSFPVALSISSTGFIILANRHFSARKWLPFDFTLAPAAATLGIAWLVRQGWDRVPADTLFSMLQWVPVDWADERWPSVFAIAIQGGIYTVAFGTLTLVMPGLSRREKDQIIRLIPFGHRVQEFFKSTLG